MPSQLFTSPKTPPPSGQTTTTSSGSTKLAEFQQKDFNEIEVEPSSSKTEPKGETFKKASFFPDIKRNNAVPIKCSSHIKLLLPVIVAVCAHKYFHHITYAIKI